MKKLLCIILSLVITLATAACASDAIPTTETAETTAAPTTVATHPTETTSGGSADYQAPMTAVSFPTVCDARTDDSGKIISKYSYPEFDLSLADADVAETVRLDLLNRVDATTSTAKAMHEAAKAHASNEDFQPYVYDVRYLVGRLDQNVLSFFSTETYFDGTPRTLQAEHSVSYDLSTGNVLNLKSIMQEDYSADILADLIVESLAAHGESLFEDYEITVKDKFSTNVPVDNWYFSNEGLCFYFSPYEIAPGTLGTVEAVVSYTKLSGMLNEQYFPSEPLTYTGKMNAKNVSSDFASATAAYSQFSELTLTPGKDQILLTAEGSVADVRIYSVDDGEGNTMIFAAAGLGAEDCILIEADIASVSGKLNVQWLTENATVVQTLHEDGLK
jgi:hypothetical protein